jgi:3-oxoacyl-[acyl-carrier protein] reductase
LVWHTALGFARERCRVAAWDLRVSALTHFERRVPDAGGQGLFRQIDVTAARDVEEGAREIFDHWSRVDGLINNAGIIRDAQLVRWKDGRVGDRRRRHSERIFDRGRLWKLRANELRGRQGRSHRLYTNLVPRIRQAQHAREGSSTRFYSNGDGTHNPSESDATYGRAHTARTYRTPEDVAEAYVWLASDAVSFIRGIVLPVDGGLVLGT